MGKRVCSWVPASQSVTQQPTFPSTLTQGDWLPHLCKVSERFSEFLQNIKFASKVVLRWHYFQKIQTCKTPKDGWIVMWLPSYKWLTHLLSCCVLKLLLHLRFMILLQPFSLVGQWLVSRRSCSKCQILTVTQNQKTTRLCQAPSTSFMCPTFKICTPEEVWEKKW